ncbi:TetR/AcrR family transcriptional regulator [Rhodovulum sulfidophilum]|uniref:TetR/AcrR family transcriptional regulator n=1 Tax=Rhodovulum sulfidophilum TaxID=35806 RepID=UPI000952A3D8|nr:TetR/AcrR family transcriptional regulator [Rhodovulum sulfidophilum]MBL3554031.1 TetR/AcrR family transcriptional regulator [Rhodovulum sulfidophilum]OLS48006.1 TetR family transcriptional regulator [Rhodovulum sulfidophilum]
MTRPRGRPPRADAPVSRDEMLTAALTLLDDEGAEAFTMRALAKRLNVNPMTIHHHFGGRDGLIGAMSERLHARISAPQEGTATERIRGLLKAYHAQVLLHPGLTMLIFSRPAVFPEQAKRITEELSALLAKAGLPDRKRRLWLDILVDVTHGAALATAMAGRKAVDDPAGDQGYGATLDELLNCLGDEAALRTESG